MILHRNKMCKQSKYILACSKYPFANLRLPSELQYYSHISPVSRLDTYSHLRIPCRELRTSELIAKGHESPWGLRAENIAYSVFSRFFSHAMLERHQFRSQVKHTFAPLES